MTEGAQERGGDASRAALTRGLRSPVLLAGLYLWTVAVAPSLAPPWSIGARGAHTGHPAAAALSAGVALALLVASRLVARRDDAARLLGIWGFFGASLGALLFAPERIDVARIDPTRGALASLGFVLYAMSWGVDARSRPPEADPRADPGARFEPRARPGRAPMVIAGVGVVTAAALLYAAFGVRDVPRATLAHAVAGLASVAMVTAAAQVATRRDEDRALPAGGRYRRAATTLALLVAVVTAGLLARALDR